MEIAGHWFDVWVYFGDEQHSHFPPFPRFLSTNCFKFMMDLNIQNKKMPNVAQRIIVNKDMDVIS